VVQQELVGRRPIPLFCSPGLELSVVTLQNGVPDGGLPGFLIDDFNKLAVGLTFQSHDRFQ
jgi:hypothetical protein